MVLKLFLLMRRRHDRVFFFENIYSFFLGKFKISIHFREFVCSQQESKLNKLILRNVVTCI